MEKVILKDLCKTYTLPGETVHALQNVDLTVSEGEFVAIMGRSGCGKTTLLKILGTLLSPTSGTYLLNGQDVSQLTEAQISCLRRREIGFVFQQYQLLQHYTIWENICMPLYLDRKTPDQSYLKELAASCGIQEKLNLYPGQLSGGEQQRAAWIRAMACRPAVILADEPTGNLDYHTGQSVLQTMSACMRRYRQTAILVTHDNETASYADRILIMEDGAFRRNV